MAEKWAYHATKRSRLSSVAAQGLVPVQNPQIQDYLLDEGREEEAFSFDATVYFAQDPAIAWEYGDTLLRFPMPDDAQDAAAFQEWITGNTQGAFGMVTTTPIPPEKIEVLADKSGDWVKIKRFVRE